MPTQAWIYSKGFVSKSVSVMTQPMNKMPLDIYKIRNWLISHFHINFESKLWNARLFSYLQHKQQNEFTFYSQRSCILMRFQVTIKRLNKLGIRKETVIRTWCWCMFCLLCWSTLMCNRGKWCYSGDSWNVADFDMEHICGSEELICPVLEVDPGDWYDYFIYKRNSHSTEF